MQLFSPTYYKKFNCIASKCNHSCCVDWEIDIDEDAIVRFKSSPKSYRDEILGSIYTDGEGVSHFRLDSDGRCPHLDCNGLCKIILRLGEEYLCNICREHPRFYNLTSRGYEVGLGAVCEEACKIILTSDEYSTRDLIGDIKENSPTPSYDAVGEREKLYRLLSDRSVKYETRLAEIRRLYKIDLAAFTDEEWRCTLGELEYIDSEDSVLFECYESSAVTPDGMEIYRERFLAYLIYRHASAAESERDFRRAVAFSLLCEGLFSSLIKAKDAKGLDELSSLAIIISKEIEYSTENKDSLLIDLEFVI